MFLLITITAFAQPSGWIWQNPLPQGSDLSAVWFTDANTGTAVGAWSMLNLF